MLNPRAFSNSRPDGFGVLEVPGTSEPRFVPLMRTDLSGEVVGPLAALTLAQSFALPGAPTDPPIEALYRFPLPGDAAVTGVRVRFGDVEVKTTLKERETAEAEYDEAKQSGRQAALVTRESPDVFTLAVAGIKPGEDVTVETSYVQLARPEGNGFSLRVPLTTSPRYVRADELHSRHAKGQPLALLRDPGHRFALALNIRNADRIGSPTHLLAVEGSSVRLKDGDGIPDRDCVLTWQPVTAADKPALRVWVQPDPATGQAYFLALASPPNAKPQPVPREVVLLVDHSGSMEGPKWEAADWAVEKFLSGLSEHDSFAFGLFHNTTRWLSKMLQPATKGTVRQAVEFLKGHRDSGGTELGVALEQALGLPRANAPSRHVLVITDAEVTDAGRLLRLVEREAPRADRRRVSVLCIDAAPNAGLAAELAARGGGVSRFLTSDPAEDDIATALDDVLADWAAPVFAGLTLEVNRLGAEAAGRDVALLAGGSPASAIDLGDLPAGRPVWAVGRAGLGTGPLAFRLRTSANETLAECKAENEPAVGLKALFGSDLIRRLEYVMAGGFVGEELMAELARLGQTLSATGTKVYAENAYDDAAALLKPILVRESLAAGLPCSETAFVAVRTEAGKQVAGTVLVANALPSGWSEVFLGNGGVSSCLMAAPAAALGFTDSGVVDSMLADFDGAAPLPALSEELTSPFARAVPRGGRLLAGAPEPQTKARSRGPMEVHIAVAAGQHPVGNDAVLFDSANATLPPELRFTSLEVRMPGGEALAGELDPGLRLLLYVGDAATPRAKVKLADVLRLGGTRPLNLRRNRGDIVRLVLDDPNGAWAKGVPVLEIVLSWN